MLAAGCGCSGTCGGWLMAFGCGDGGGFVPKASEP